jgi:hypothetical protein
MFAFIYLLVAHSLITAMMTGIIWFVQVVHYPLFPLAGGANFPLYQRRHESGITRVVVPLMLVELATAIALLFVFPAGISRSLFYLSLVLLLINWLSTFLLQVPQHRRLKAGFDIAAWQVLYRSNWVRTISWSIRVIILLLILARQLSLV